jgi:hypothetical protein
MKTIQRRVLQLEGGGSYVPCLECEMAALNRTVRDEPSPDPGPCRHGVKTTLLSHLVALNSIDAAAEAQQKDDQHEIH